MVWSIFGYDGLLNSDDSFSFESKFADMNTESIISKVPNIQTHLEKPFKTYSPQQRFQTSSKWNSNRIMDK